MPSKPDYQKLAQKVLDFRGDPFLLFQLVRDLLERLWETKVTESESPLAYQPGHAALISMERKVLIDVAEPGSLPA